MTMDDYALLDKDGDAEPRCPGCECELGWVQCGACEEGEIDAYELDPGRYDPFEMMPCAQCAGAGGWYVCVNPLCTEVQC